MSTAEIRADGHGRFRVTGPVVFATAGRLLDESHDLFAGTAPLRLDLSGVTQVDSAALALLVEWLRLAKLVDRDIRFEGIPERLRAIARLTGIDDMIGMVTD